MQLQSTFVLSLISTCFIQFGQFQLPGEPTIITETLTQVVDPGRDCVYTIHLKNSSGPLAQSVQLGTELYHKIICRSSKSEAKSSSYCLIVYNCSISSSSRLSSGSYQLIDEDGCTQEPSLIGNVQYPSDTEAGILAQAIRVNGDAGMHMSLSCQSRFIPKESQTCFQKRPRCSSDGHTTAKYL